jgi:glycosyltransferase involved in cell wall biosynthesis
MSRIAIFDYRVTSTNPIGSCHLRLLGGLCHEHEFTVFAVQFENPCPERIRWVRVPVPLRPLALLFLAYHVVAPLMLLRYLIRGGPAFDLIQIVESNLSFGDLAYVHFCHRAYLQQHWPTSKPAGLRGVLRWLDHRLHALIEPLAYRRVRRVVVPSPGLGQELAALYPATRAKACVVANAIDIERLRRPPDFHPEDVRRRLGVRDGDTLLVFSALGQFERKGLPLLLDALRGLRDESVKLVVIGGEHDLVSMYRARAGQAGLRRQVTFVGLQRDVRPTLWAADAFVFPSAYEAFSLVAFEAAAAGVLLIATAVNGVREFLRDGENGILVARTPAAVMHGIARFLALAPDERARMTVRAQDEVQAFGPTRFVGAWREVYNELSPPGRAHR